MKSQIPNEEKVASSELRVESSEKLVESAESKIEISAENTQPETKEEPETRNPKLETELKPETRNAQPATTNISALSLGSIRAKKELMEAQKGVVKVEEHLPSEDFTETEMLELWYRFADRLGDKGSKIMESLLRISDPKLDGTIIIYELPNEGSKIDFDKAKPELLGYLRGHLHNHDITIEVIVNEEVKVKNAFTPQDKYNRLNEINPNLELLKKTFDLDL
ncbi:DNA polymerase III subunit gamma/tau [Flavobacterium sp.]|uniref:DNA polymerase III subunit gamma/tau n=1 Tax=Flavobacterium sp. TaxID=239 RepID=UPI0026361A24|nr:DNA polymerase III subunit gamma/tau [Flavobacterium sp.]